MPRLLHQCAFVVIRSNLQMAEHNDRIMPKADWQWRGLAARRKKIDIDGRYAAQIDHIVEAAKTELFDLEELLT